MRLSILALVVLTACSSATEARDETRVLGAIAGYNDDDPRIEIATSGRTVTVSVTTYGNGCTREGPTEVNVQGMEALISPYDFEPRPGNFACPDILLSFTHEVAVQFAAAGEARIRVRGRRLQLSPVRHDTITVERTVVLQ